jgi:hypothetical protein
MSYQFRNSIEAKVSRQTAWDFWTMVKNWEFDPAVESIKLEGEFAEGSKGITKTKGGVEPIAWEIKSVTPGERAVIEIPLAGAVVSFAWSFESADENKARLTQVITLVGEKADDYLPMVGQGFEDGVRQGMARLAVEMEKVA